MSNQFAVVQCYDGCPDDSYLFTGNRDECLTYMRSMKKNKPKVWKSRNEGKWSMDIIDLQTQRFVSYAL